MENGVITVINKFGVVETYTNIEIILLYVTIFSLFSILAYLVIDLMKYK